MVLNSLSFCLSVKLLVSPSYLNEILTGYSNLGISLSFLLVYTAVFGVAFLYSGSLWFLFIVEVPQ